MIKPEIKLLVENWKSFIKIDTNTLNETVRIGDFNFDDQAAALINQEVGNIQNLTVDIANHAGGNVSERDGMVFYNGLKFEPSEFVKLLKNTNFDKLIAQKKSGNAGQASSQQPATTQQQPATTPKQKITNALLEKNPNGIGRKNESLINAFQSMINNYIDGIWGFGGIKVASHPNDPKLFNVASKPEVKNIIKDEAKTLLGNRVNYRIDPKSFEDSANKAYDIYVIISKNLSILKKEYEASNQTNFFNNKLGQCVKDLNTFYQELQKFLK